MSTNQHDENKDRFLEVGKEVTSRVYKFYYRKQYTLNSELTKKNIQAKPR